MNVQPLIDGFSTEGTYLRSQRIEEGHINDTFIQTYATENGERRYVLQRINRAVFPDVPAMMQNIARVTSHLAGRSLTLVPTRDGAPFALDSAGDYWRLYDFVTNGRTFKRTASIAEVTVAARAFGEFALALSDLPGDPLHETIPHFHDTELRFRSFVAAVEADRCNRASSVRSDIASYESRAALAGELASLHQRAGTQPRVVHNDAKINNVILSRSGRGGTVIDLDTVMPGYPLYDIGDLLRTAATTAAEDELDLDLVGVHTELAEAISNGYRAGIGSGFSAAEAAAIPTAAKVITFETGLRFLTDYLNGDRYFRIHRPLHNVERARNQFALAIAFERYESEILR